MSNVKGFRAKKAPTKQELAQNSDKLNQAMQGLHQTNKFLSQQLMRLLNDVQHQAREIGALTELIGARQVPQKEVLKDGDVAILNFIGTVDGLPFDGGMGKKTAVRLGSNNFIPGFEDALVGRKIGEMFEVSITFPEKYAPELANKEAVFYVQLLEAYRDLVDSSSFDSKVDELMKLKEEKEKADAKAKEEQASDSKEAKSEAQAEQQQ